MNVSNIIMKDWIKMKKVLLISFTFVFSSFMMCEKVMASKLQQMFGGKDSSQSSGSGTNAFHEISQQAGSIGDSLNNSIKENYSSNGDVASLFGLMIFTRNVSTLFDWLNIANSELKNCLEKIQRAQNEDEEQELTAAKELAKKITQMLLGNGMRSLRANVKASATIYIKIIQSLKFSNVGIEALKQDMSNLIEQCGRIRAAKRALISTVENIFKAVNEDLEETSRNELNQLMTDMESSIEVLDKINIYFTEKALPSEDTDQLLEKCSLAGEIEETSLNEDETDINDENVQEREATLDEEEDIGEQDNKKKKKSKKSTKISSEEEEEEEDANEGNPVKKKKKKAKKNKKNKK
jgi:hypothetical protein